MNTSILTNETDFIETDSRLLEELRVVAPRVELFDFDANWDLVRPYLEAPEVLAALDRGMRELSACRPNPADHRWDPRKGPWWSSPFFDYWPQVIDERVYASGWSWEPPPGVELPDGDVLPDDLEAQVLASFNAEWEKQAPRPGAPDWYRCYGGCDWMAPWAAAVGRRVFRELAWAVVRGKHDTVAWGRAPGNPGVLMDILWKPAEDRTAADVVRFKEHWEPGPRGPGLGRVST